VRVRLGLMSFDVRCIDLATLPQFHPGRNRAASPSPIHQRNEDVATRGAAIRDSSLGLPQATSVTWVCGNANANTAGSLAGAKRSRWQNVRSWGCT